MKRIPDRSILPTGPPDAAGSDPYTLYRYIQGEIRGL